MYDLNTKDSQEKENVFTTLILKKNFREREKAHSTLSTIFFDIHSMTFHGYF